eukprot:g9869.t1
METVTDLLGVERVGAPHPQQQFPVSSTSAGDSGGGSVGSGGVGGVGGGGGGDGDGGDGGNGRRKTEMAKERNRVHARKMLRAEVAHNKEAAAKAEAEQMARWTATLQRVLDLRCNGVVDEAVWSDVLTEDFELSLPLTPYRPFDPADVEEGRRRVMVGVEGMISDTTSLTEMCTTLAERCSQQGQGGGGGSGGGGGDPRPRVQLKAHVSNGDLVFSSGEGIMCVFSTTTVDACDFGSPLEVETNGMLRASFGEDGKLDELEMMFDGVAVHQQLQRAMGAIS